MTNVLDISIEGALQRNNPRELAIGYMRYETLRKLNNRQFAYLNKLNLEGRNFDDMVDEIAAGTFDWSGFDIAWCDRDHAEFPELCPEYDPKHSHHHA